MEDIECRVECINNHDINRFQFIIEVVRIIAYLRNGERFIYSNVKDSRNIK